ncbi:hypothetical protein D7S70_20280 [Ralstonia pickettii]|nr:hypothetical protein [Ralstonia pickettii]MBB0036811.1 hypothetical protein [Ralstonia pickettii]MBB0099351.1 hypothetical protein [Ralstonia pickettii]MBB0109146.1 hypothetical protein [Ralstonia pickettii]MBB0130125.1 hypothetical protein [Ralstonia pickettii]
MQPFDNSLLLPGPGSTVLHVGAEQVQIPDASALGFGAVINNKLPRCATHIHVVVNVEFVHGVPFLPVAPHD